VKRLSFLTGMSVRSPTSFRIEANPLLGKRVSIFETSVERDATSLRFRQPHLSTRQSVYLCCGQPVKGSRSSVELSQFRLTPAVSSAPLPSFG